MVVAEEAGNPDAIENFSPGTLEEFYPIGVLALLAPEPEVSARITPD